MRGRSISKAFGHSISVLIALVQGVKRHLLRARSTSKAFQHSKSVPLAALQPLPGTVSEGPTSFQALASTQNLSLQEVAGAARGTTFEGPRRLHTLAALKICPFQAAQAPKGSTFEGSKRLQALPALKPRPLQARKGRKGGTF